MIQDGCEEAVVGMKSVEGGNGVGERDGVIGGALAGLKECGLGEAVERGGVRNDDADLPRDEIGGEVQREFKLIGRALVRLESRKDLEHIAGTGFRLAEGCGFKGCGAAFGHDFDGQVQAGEERTFRSVAVDAAEALVDVERDPDGGGLRVGGGNETVEADGRLALDVQVSP